MLQKFYDEEKIERSNRYIIYILLFMMCVIPIATYKYISMSYSPKYMNNIYTSGQKTDVFNFFKALILYVGTFSIFGMFMYRVIKLKQEIKNSKLNIFLVVFAIGIVLSAFLSEYKDIALFGNFDRHEGSLAWFCYIIIFFVLYNIKIEDKYYKLFYFMLIPFLVINAILGILNLYGIDILKSGIVQFIIGGHGTIGGQLWTTLYNPNFSSGVSGVIFSMSCMYFLLEEDRTNKIAVLLGAILSFIILLTSKAFSGFIAIVLMIPLIILIGWKFRDGKKVILSTSLLVVINGLLLMIMGRYDARVYDETIGYFAKIHNISPVIIPAGIIALIILIILMKFINKKKFFIGVTILGICFMLAAGGGYLYVANTKVEGTSKTILENFEKSSTFESLENFSSGRATIWNAAMKQSIERPILGHGLDTLPYVLDQSEIGGVYDTIKIDKPHNLLLILFYGTGLVGLIGFMGTMWYIIKEAFYKYVDNVDDKFLYISTIGVVSFLMQGILNDTFVGTSIVFWIFAGICANRLISDNSKNE